MRLQRHACTETGFYRDMRLQRRAFTETGFYRGRLLQTSFYLKHGRELQPKRGLSVSDGCGADKNSVQMTRTRTRTPTHTQTDTCTRAHARARAQLHNRRRMRTRHTRLPHHENMSLRPHHVQLLIFSDESCRGLLKRDWCARRPSTSSCNKNVKAMQHDERNHPPQRQRLGREHVLAATPTRKGTAVTA